MAEIAAYIGHDDEGKPALVLYRKIEPEGKKAYIKLNDAWKFSQDHNENFEAHIENIVDVAYDYFNMGNLHTSRKVRAQRMAEIATLIEQGIDELLKAPPATQEETRPIADFEANFNGEKVEGTLNA